MAKKIKNEIVPLSAGTTPAKLNKQLQDALKVIDEKLHSLGVSTTKPYLYKNASTFKYNELDQNTVNIQTCVDVVFLIKALAKMRRIEKEYIEAAESCVDTYPAPTWYGYPVSNWISDLEYRIKLVANSVKINQLTQSKVELTQFLSQEDRLKDRLSQVAKLLE